MTEAEKTVEQILDDHVRAKLAEHGGNVSVSEIRDGVVYIRLSGHCSGCPSASYTLENLIKEEILARTDLVRDVRLQEEVSEELYAFAKALLRQKREEQK